MAAARRTTILIATGNPGKAREIRAVLSDPDSERDGTGRIRWLTFADLPATISEPIENGDSFAANAALKARYYSLETGLWALADDSGLEVDALGGEPGVRSARFAQVPEGSPRDVRDAANNRKLIAELQGVPAVPRTARFRCALALADGNRIKASAEGVFEGLIVDRPRGQNGFGYDPHFLVTELDRTAAELAPEHKNRLSHRGQALRQLREQLKRLCLE